jgi:hypothetical protein
MTNSARYATGSAVAVTVTWDRAQLCVRVRDHGLPAGHEPSGVKGGGTGISSMAGRIEAAGGRLTAGPLTDPLADSLADGSLAGGPGWLVELSVPVISSGSEVDV